MSADAYKPASYYVLDSGKVKHGLYYQPPVKQSKDGESEIPPATWICDPLEAVARSRDGDSNNHGLLLEWIDPDGKTHDWVMPFELLGGDGAEVRRVLMNGGLKISVKKNAKDLLLGWLLEQKPKTVARSVFAIGWQDGGVYVLHDQVFGG